MVAIAGWTLRNTQACFSYLTCWFTDHPARIGPERVIYWLSGCHSVGESFLFLASSSPTSLFRSCTCGYDSMHWGRRFRWNSLLPASIWVVHQLHFTSLFLCLLKHESRCEGVLHIGWNQTALFLFILIFHVLFWRWHIGRKVSTIASNEWRSARHYSMTRPFLDDRSSEVSRCYLPVMLPIGDRGASEYTLTWPQLQWETYIILLRD